MKDNRIELGFGVFDLKVMRESFESQQLKYISAGLGNSKEAERLEIMLGRVRSAIVKLGGV